MNKLTLFFVLILGCVIRLSAQDSTSSPTSKGSWLIEANTSFGKGHSANTGFLLRELDGTTIWNIGAEGGYFVADDLAVKLGLGYGDNSNSPGFFSYKGGAKYYIKGVVPVQVDLNGISSKIFDNYNPLFLGIQGGYAWFVADNIAVEPGLRYDFGLNDDAEASEGVAFNIGFSLYF